MENGPVAYPAWVGVPVALVVGALVRLLRLPIPAPPTLYGALMVVGLTAGYLIMHRILMR